MRKFSSIEDWEKNQERILSLRDTLTLNVEAGLEHYAKFIDYESIEYHDGDEQSTFYINLIIPKNDPIVKGQERQSIKDEIFVYIGSSSYTGPGGPYEKTNVYVKDLNDVWKVYITKNWGYDI